MNTTQITAWAWGNRANFGSMKTMNIKLEPEWSSASRIARRNDISLTEANAALDHLVKTGKAEMSKGTLLEGEEAYYRPVAGQTTLDA